MIKNIIFDLGGVVVGRDYALHGDMLESFRFLQGEDFPQYWKDFDMGIATQKETARAISEKEGYGEQDAYQILDRIRGLYNEFPATVGLIKELHSEGYKLYVLSNMPKEFYDYMKSFEVFRYFDGVVISSTEKMSKPDTRIFTLILNRYGLVPKETVFVDDKVMNISAAEKLGMRTCLFDATGSGCDDLREIIKNGKI